MDPIDYTSAFSNVPAPGTSFLQGIQGGAAIGELQLKRQQEQAALVQKQQMQADLAKLSTNPTPDAIGALMVKYPALSEQLKRGADVLAPAQQQAQLEHGTQVYAAVLNGQPDIAQRLLTERAAALRNSGNEKEAQAADTFATMIKDHPEFAKTTMGLRLASAMGPDKFAAAFKDIGAEQRATEMQPDVVRKGAADADAAVSGADSAKSKAVTDAVDAKYADKSALLKMEGVKSDIEFKRQQTKIAYLNAQISRETNTLKRQELSLQVQKATQERDDKVREKVATAESAASATDNMLNTVDRILANKSLGSVLGSIQGRVGAYLNDDAADAIAQIETLGSQAFIAQIPSMKGTGSLSEKEGDKLQASLQNLSRVQSEDQFKANLAEVQRIAKKARDNISKRYGVPLGNPDTPAAAGKRPPLSSFGG